MLQVLSEDRVGRFTAGLTARVKEWGHCRTEKKKDPHPIAWSVISAGERGAGPWDIELPDLCYFEIKAVKANKDGEQSGPLSDLGTRAFLPLVRLLSWEIQRGQVIPTFVGLSEPCVVGYLEEDFPGTCLSQ